MSTFSIRPYRLDDVDEVYAAADESRQHIAKWMDWMTPEYSREHAEAWVKQAVAWWENEVNFEHVIVDDADGSIAGSCGLNHLDRVNGFCNLGYWVRTSKIGQGAALQATQLLRDFGFETLGLNRLEIVIAEGNLHSRQVAERTGAVYEGLQRSRLKIFGRVHHAHMFALLNPSVNPVQAKP